MREVLRKSITLLNLAWTWLKSTWTGLTVCAILFLVVGILFVLGAEGTIGAFGVLFIYFGAYCFGMAEKTFYNH